MIALLDADIITYRCGYASENDAEDIALIRTDSMIREILAETGADSYEVWLSDNSSNNFRYEIDPEYKANRKQPRPKHYLAIQDFLYKEWNAQLALGQEADDALGIRQTVLNSTPIFPRGVGGQQLRGTDSVICSIDKDLLQIEGNHYNFVKKEFHTVELIDGIRHFWKQMLIGDVSDNVRGIEKIGPVKAGRLLDGISDDHAMCVLVRELYSDDVRFTRNAKLLWIRREEDEVWSLEKVMPALQEQEPKLLSTLPTAGENVQSLGPITAEKNGSPLLGYPMDDSMRNTELTLT